MFKTKTWTNIMLLLCVLGLSTEYSHSWTQPPKCLPFGRSVFIFNRAHNTACISHMSWVLVAVLNRSRTLDSDILVQTFTAAGYYTIRMFAFDNVLVFVWPENGPVTNEYILQGKTELVVPQYTPWNCTTGLYNFWIHVSEINIVLQCGSCCMVYFAAMIHAVISVKWAEK